MPPLRKLVFFVRCSRSTNQPHSNVSVSLTINLAARSWKSQRMNKKSALIQIRLQDDQQTRICGSLSVVRLCSNSNAYSIQLTVHTVRNLGWFTYYETVRVSVPKARFLFVTRLMCSWINHENAKNFWPTIIDIHPRCSAPGVSDCHPWPLLSSHHSFLLRLPPSPTFSGVRKGTSGTSIAVSTSHTTSCQTKT